MNWAALKDTPLTIGDPFALPLADQIGHVEHDAIALLDRDARVFQRPPAWFIDDEKNYGYAAPTQTPREIHNARRFVMVLHDVLLVGHRWLITREGKIYTDVHDFRARLNEMAGSTEPHTNEHSGFHPVEGGYSTLKLSALPVVIDEPCHFFTGAEPFNFGFWLTKILPKFGVAKKRGIGDLPMFGFAPFEWHRNLLKLFEADARHIPHDLNQVYHLKKVFVAGNFNTSFALDEDSKRQYDAIAHRTASAAAKPPAKVIYISRLSQGKRDPNYRLFINEQDLVDRLQALGVAIIEPEKMPLEQAVQAFHNASLIIGPSGAGMFNCVFARSGAKVVSFESFPYWLQGHANLFSSRGLNYAIVLGDADESDPTPIQKRWQLNVEHAMQVLTPVIEQA